jgi:hypothetical protein
MGKVQRMESPPSVFESGLPIHHYGDRRSRAKIERLIDEETLSVAADVPRIGSRQGGFE